MKNEFNRNPPSGFCERLLNTRIQKGYSRAYLAKKIQISEQSIKGYEGGWITPTITICSKLAAELNVTLDWLVNGKEK